MSFAIPVERLHETDTLLAFYHPRPLHPVHILLVPRKAIPALTDLVAEDSQFLADVFETTGLLVRRLGLAEQGYCLVVNGGAYQDILQLHFHLISGAALPG
ncbi:MAG: HIT domain-containing protein [Anaerolineales bacterium]|nr:HIT domain-containing protein [Anaerolineales bacterium]